MVVVVFAAFLTFLVLGAIGVISLLGGEGPEVIDAPPNVENPLSNGDFETGDLTDWTVYWHSDSNNPCLDDCEALDWHSDSNNPCLGDCGLDSWGVPWGGWFVYEDARKPPTGTDGHRMRPGGELDSTIGGVGFRLFDPPQGDYAAVSVHPDRGVSLLYRDFVVEGPSVLRATVFYKWPHASPWQNRLGLISPERLGVDSVLDASANQQYRIDLIDPAASIDSLAKEDVLGTVFSTMDGDPFSLEPTEVTFDLSPWEGQTIRLRVVEVDLNFAGIDDVRIERAQSDTVSVVKRMLQAFEENDPAAFRAEYAADAVLINMDEERDEYDSNNLDGERDGVFSSAEWVIDDFDGDGVASPFDADQFWMAFEPLIRGETKTACWGLFPVAPGVVECTFCATNAFTSAASTATGEALPPYCEYWVRHFWLNEGKIVAEERFDCSDESQTQQSDERVYAPGLGNDQQSQQEMFEAFQTYETWVRVNHTKLWSELFRDPVLSASLIYSPDAIAIHEQLVAEYLSRQ